jgi:hypothetical protein
MFPVMPYSHYGKMDPEDIKSIIAYIRSLAPIQNESVSDFPMNFILNTIPGKANPQTKPLASDQLAYGSYMTNVYSCIECHTKVEKGRIVQDLGFSGGREFLMKDGSTVRSSNIT